MPVAKTGECFAHTKTIKLLLMNFNFKLYHKFAFTKYYTIIKIIPVSVVI